MSKRLEITEYDKEQLASRIKSFREYLGLTCKEFGERIGYTGPYISQIELGARDIPVNSLNLICEVYQIEEAYFSGEITLEDATKNIPTQAEVDAERAERVKALREERGLNQTMLGDIAGIDHKAISKIETGVCPLDIEQAKMIAQGLNIGLDWLLYGDEDRKYYPINDKIVEWLWSRKDIRKMIWELYNANNGK